MLTPQEERSARLAKIGAYTVAATSVRRDAPDMGRTVLIVDDHPGFRVWARTWLEAEGFTVVGDVGSGEEALAALRDGQPEIILLDVQLPCMDGFEVASQVAQMRPATAVVLTSVRSAAVYALQLSVALGRHARAFIPKDELSAARLAAAIGPPP